LGRIRPNLTQPLARRLRPDPPTADVTNSSQRVDSVNSV